MSETIRMRSPSVATGTTPGPATRSFVLAGTKSPPKPRADATTVAIAYLAVLSLVPARLVLVGLPFNVTPAMVIGYLALLWWWVSRFVPGLGPDRAFQPVRIAVWGFWAVLLLSYAHGFMSHLDPDLARRGDRQIITFLAPVGIAMLVADGVRSWDRLERLVRVFCALATAVGVIGMVQFLFRVDPTSVLTIPGLHPVFALDSIEARSDFARPAGTALHAIEFGAVLAAALPPALHLTLGAPPGRTRRLWWASTMLIATAMLMSLSRSAILATVGSAAVLWLSWSKERRVVALLTLPVFLAAVRFAVPGLVGTLTSLFSNFSEDPSIQGRTTDYAEAATHWRSSPILGTGLGTSTQLLDNQYLGTVIETGIVGVGGLLALLFVAYFAARGARLRAAAPRNRELAVALSASAVGPVISLATFDAFAFPMFTGVTFLLIGLCGAAWRLALADQRRDPPPETPGTWRFR